MNCARQLASRCIHLTVFVPDSVRLSDAVGVELRLLELSGAKLTTSNYKSRLQYYIIYVELLQTV